MELQRISVSLLRCNTGQLKGVPKNPRTIKGEMYKKLLKSIKDDPELLEAKPLIVVENDSIFVVVAGNMRFTACKELNYTHIPCAIVPPNTDSGKIRSYATKDNNHYGDWDVDLLNEEWDVDLLDDSGYNIAELPQPIDAEIKPMGNNAIAAKECPHCGGEL